MYIVYVDFVDNVSPCRVYTMCADHERYWPHPGTRYVLVLVWVLFTTSSLVPRPACAPGGSGGIVDLSPLQKHSGISVLIQYASTM